MILVEYISVRQAAEQWSISDRRVRFLCEQGIILVCASDCVYCFPVFTTIKHHAVSLALPSDSAFDKCFMENDSSFS